MLSLKLTSLLTNYSMSKQFASFFSILKWYLLVMLEQRSLLLTALVGNFISGVLVARQLQSYALLSSTPFSLGDALFAAYAGPALGTMDVTWVSIWLLNLMGFLLLASPLVRKHAHTMNYPILLRIGSRRKWVAGILIATFIAAPAYVSLIMVSTLCGIGLVQGWHIQQTSFFYEELGIWTTLSHLSLVQIWTMIWLLLVSSFIVHGYLLTFLILKLRQIIWPLLFIFVLALLTWQVGAGDTVHPWQVWLPATHSIVSRHSPFEEGLPTFTLSYSLKYNLAAGLTAILVAVQAVASLDFTGGFHDRG